MSNSGTMRSGFDAGLADLGAAQQGLARKARANVSQSLVDTPVSPAFFSFFPGISEPTQHHLGTEF